MLYFDTSFLIPLFIPETETGRIETLFKTLSGDDFAMSHWTRVEFASAIGIKVRMKELSASQGAKVISEFESFASHSFLMLAPGVADFQLADHYLRNFRLGLRSGDALHLAIAKNHSASFLYSLDQQLLGAAKHFGIKAGKG